MNSIYKTLSTLLIVLDQLEYFEQKIDRYIDWLAQDNPNSFLKDKKMVELDHDIKFFQHRYQELEQERGQIVSQRLSQFKTELADLRYAKPSVSEIGAPHQVEMRQQLWLEKKISILETERDQEIKLIFSRYTALMQRCEHRVEQARVQINEAYQRYQNQSIERTA